MCGGDFTFPASWSGMVITSLCWDRYNGYKHSLLCGLVPADSGGWFLQQLLLWRQQRQQAINKELDRLQRQLQRVKLGEAGQADGGTYGKLTEWLEANSAVVRLSNRTSWRRWLLGMSCKAAYLGSLYRSLQGLSPV